LTIDNLKKEKTNLKLIIDYVLFSIDKVFECFSPPKACAMWRANKYS